MAERPGLQLRTSDPFPGQAALPSSEWVSLLMSPCSSWEKEEKRKPTGEVEVMGSTDCLQEFTSHTDYLARLDNTPRHNLRVQEG